MPNTAPVNTQYTADTRQAEAGMRRMQRSARSMIQWSRNLRAGLLGMNNMLMGAGAVMVAGGIAMRSAIRSTEAYSNAQAQLRSVMVSSNLPMARQEELMRTSDVQAARYGMSFAETARGLIDFSEAGYNTHEIMRYFPIAAEFAVAGNMDLARSVNMLQGSMHQFNVQSEADSRDMAGGLLTAARISSTSVDELQQAFRYAAVEASGLGYNYREVTGALAGLSIMNLRGSIAGTRLRAVLAGLNRISQRTSDVARESGVSMDELNHILYDSAGNTLPLRDAFRNLSGIFARLPTDMEKNRLAVSLFGRYGMSAGMMFANMNGQLGQFEEILDQISDPTRNAATMTAAAEEAMKGFGAQMRLARSAAENFGIGMGEIFIGMDTTEEGFGRYLMTLSEAVRLSDENARSTDTARERWAELSPEMQRTGTDLRNTLKGLAQLGFALAWVGAHLGRFIGQHPTLTVWLLAVGSALRPLITLLLTNSRVAGLAGRGILGLTRFMMGSRAGTAVFSGGLAGVATSMGVLLVAYVSLKLAHAGMMRRLAQMDALHDYEEANNQLRTSLDAVGLGFTLQIPIIGELINAYGTLVALAIKLHGVNQTLEAQRTRDRERMLMGASERVSARAAQIQQRGIGALESRRMAANSEMAQLIMSSASLRESHALGVSAQRNAEISFNMFSRRLQDAGMSVSEAESMRNQFMSASMNATREDTRAVTRQGLTPENLTSSIAELYAYRRDVVGPELSLAGAGRDVRQGYVASETSDVDKRLMTSAIEQTLLSTGVSANEVRQIVGIQPEGGQSVQTIDAVINVNVTGEVDGRELIKITGQQQVQADARRGIQASPGSRRQAAQGAGPSYSNHSYDNGR